MTENLTMFAREVDFKLEVTYNSYAACRALSQRARDINKRFKKLPESHEPQPSATVGAVSDYSNGRIVLSEDEKEPNNEQ
ncbi:MAG: hypothetical protein VX733_14795 [Candidatus Latescibacterota bacterium]|nr:hypothetical protein [Candidatus Latescibacterota bacterium]